MQTFEYGNVFWPIPKCGKRAGFALIPTFDGKSIQFRPFPLLTIFGDELRRKGIERSAENPRQPTQSHKPQRSLLPIRPSPDPLIKHVPKDACDSINRLAYFWRILTLALWAFVRALIPRLDVNLIIWFPRRLRIRYHEPANMYRSPRSFAKPLTVVWRSFLDVNMFRNVIPNLFQSDTRTK